MARPEVQAYMERVKQRMLDRWALPADLPGNQSVAAPVPARSRRHREPRRARRAPEARLGQSAVEALRAASPFDHMPDRVRCLAGATR